jgi:hypothetical protein
MRLRVGIGRTRCEPVRVEGQLRFATPLGDRDDSVVVDYVCRRGHFVELLALAQEVWGWADARGCHSEDVWEGVSVSVYVHPCFVYGFEFVG